MRFSLALASSQKFFIQNLWPLEKLQFMFFDRFLKLFDFLENYSPKSEFSELTKLRVA